MQTNMASTSIAAYRSLGDLQRKEREVLAIFANTRIQLTREQIAERLQWKEAAVCGRVNSLVKKGELFECDGGVTRCGRSAKLLCLPGARTAEIDYLA